MFPKVFCTHSGSQEHLEDSGLGGSRCRRLKSHLWARGRPQQVAGGIAVCWGPSLCPCARGTVSFSGHDAGREVEPGIPTSQAFHTERLGVSASAGPGSSLAPEDLSVWGIRG